MERRFIILAALLSTSSFTSSALASSATCTFYGQQNSTGGQISLSVDGGGDRTTSFTGGTFDSDGFSIKANTINLSSDSGSDRIASTTASVYASGGTFLGAVTDGDGDQADVATQNFNEDGDSSVATAKCSATSDGAGE